MKHVAVIMAGGKGERFWPLSRAARPKQFLSLTGGGQTMIQLTVERLLPLVAPEDLYVVTGEKYRALAAQQLPMLPGGNILCEPQGKNTAPCVALAAGVLAAKYEDAVVYLLASDHIVQNHALFLDTMETAALMAQREENIVTIGITPTYPETGYGYIKFLRGKTAVPGVYAVDRFVEKPDAETAQSYLAAGCYLWNSGMFVWKLSTIQKSLQAFLPQLADGARRIAAADGAAQAEAVAAMYEQAQAISVDYGIMEKAQNLYTIPGSFGWDDVGSWLSLERINRIDAQGNFIQGNVVELSSQNNIFVGGQQRLLAAVGVEDLVVVETEDATLICSKAETQNVKKIVELLRTQGGARYL